MLDCIVISDIKYDVESRLSTANEIEKRCARRQYIKYKGKKRYYFDFLENIKAGDDNRKLEKEYMMKPLSLNEIKIEEVEQLRQEFLRQKISSCLINDYESQQDLFDNLIKTGVRYVVMLLGNLFNILPMLKIIRHIKRMDKTVKIILSGGYIYNKWATSSLEEFEKMKKVLNADYYVTKMPGESEICNIIKESGYSNKVVPQINWNYRNEIVELKTSIGCPAKCSFCNFPLKNGQLHYKNMQYVKEYIKNLEINGTKTIIFMDDTFNLPQKRFKKICQFLIESESKLEWYSYCRLKNLDEETVKMMSTSNCKGVFVGIESADDSILSNMNKGITVEEYKKSLLMLNKYGISVFAFLLVGFPGETKKTVQKTIDFVNSMPIEYYTVNLWYADTSTPIFKEKTKYGIRGKDFNWEHNTMNSLQASEFADKMMVEINSAVWVPNERFGFQAVPYLQRRGLSDSETKNLLRNMKELVKINILHSGANPQCYVDNIKDILIKMKFF